MTKTVTPALWLLILIIALPQVSETIYTPSLPDIARCLFVECSTAEHTLTIYLVGFACGVSLWGNVSDHFGRKPIVLIGLLIYVSACIGCFLSNSIESLMLFRFLQAFGGSVGSVIGQAMARDAFALHMRGQIFSVIGIAMSFSPALGPVIGGYLDQYFGWKSVFIFLGIAGIIIGALAKAKLPETLTHKKEKFEFNDFMNQLKNIAFNKRIFCFALIVGGCNGIIFSYYAEGPFYFIDILKMPPSHYGMISLVYAFPMIVGGLISKHLNKTQWALSKILTLGVIIVLTSTMLFTLSTKFGLINVHNSMLAIILSLLFMMMTMMGIAILIPNSLSSALQTYTVNAGQAASVFGFVYYIFIAGFTYLMGILHDGTLLAMPRYFMALAAMMFVVQRLFLNRSPSDQQK